MLCFFQDMEHMDIYFLLSSWYHLILSTHAEVHWRDLTSSMIKKKEKRNPDCPERAISAVHDLSEFGTNDAFVMNALKINQINHFSIKRSPITKTGRRFEIQPV